MKFICPKFPNLGFYVGDTRYEFHAGIFDLDEHPQDQHEAIKAALAKTHPGTGVMVEQEYSLPFACDFCDRKFATQAAKNGHKPAHKTQADIDALAWRQEGAPRTEV